MSIVTTNRDPQIMSGAHNRRIEDARAATAGPSARIGPNALIQTRRALDERHGPNVASRIYARAGCPAQIGDRMVDERHFVHLVDALREQLGSSEAAEILDRAGRYTADYVYAHRIPAPIRGLAPWLPSRFALRLLLQAIGRHAWTFAGAGDFSRTLAPMVEVQLRGSPTCRDRQLTAPGGAYYAAAFARLLGRLLDEPIEVREASCEALGDDRCTFTIRAATACAASPSELPNGEP